MAPSPPGPAPRLRRGQARDRGGRAAAPWIEARDRVDYLHKIRLVNKQARARAPGGQGR